MDEKDWKILVAIYQTKNITKAANKLYTSQPAITYRLQQIEQTIGVEIVLRNKKGLKFTSEGEYLVKYAEKMLLEFQQTKDYICNMNKNTEGIIRIGVSSNFAHYRLPKILKEFCQIYPKVQFSVKTGWSSDIFKLIQNEAVHFGIIRGDFNWNDQNILLEEEKLCIISNGKITKEELPQLPKINYQTDPLLNQLIENWWYENFKVSPQVSMEVDKLETCKEMVKNGLGYSIIPAIGLKPEDNLRTIDLLNDKNEVFKRKTSLIYRKSDLDFQVIKTFISFLENYIKVKG